MRRILLLGILCTAVLHGQSQSTPSGVSRPAHAVTIPFELVVKHVFVRVSVNHSRPLSFILDTGDKMAIVDLDRAKELGLKFKGPVEGRGAGATTITGAFVQDAQFEFPGFDGFSQPVILAFPLKSLAGPLGHDVDGVIGSDFIKEFVTEIDYQARVVRLHDKSTFRYTGHGQSVPIELNAEGHPIVEAEVTPVGGKALTGKFVLDLGSSASLALYSPFVAKNHLPGPNAKTIRAMGAAGVGGEMKARIGRVTELRIGKFRLAAPLALFRIKDVLENSTASEAGLLEGDVIASVNGRSASEFSLSDLIDMFEQPATYHLRIKRGDSLMDVTIRPRPMI